MASAGGFWTIGAVAYAAACMAAVPCVAAPAPAAPARAAAAPPEHWLEVDRFLEGPDGSTRFVRSRIPGDVGAQLKGAGASSLPRSIPIALPRVTLWYVPGGTDNRNRAPERQIVVVLSGRLSVTVSTGETRSWGAGELFLATDTGHGEGHRTRAVGGPVTLLFIPLDDGLDLGGWTMPAK